MGQALSIRINALFLLMLFLSISTSCHRFKKNFPIVTATCGQPEGQEIDELNSYRPVNSDNIAVTGNLLQASLILEDGTQQMLPFSRKGCIYLPKTAHGYVVVTDKSKATVGYYFQKSGSSTFGIQNIQLQDFPSLKPRLSCSGQDIWTNQPFVQVEWDLQRNNQSIGRDELLPLLPLLNMQFVTKSKAGEVLQLHKFSKQGNQDLAVLAQNPNRYVLQMAIAPESDSFVELTFQDILDRNLKVEGGSSCRIHMTKKKPALLIFNGDGNMLLAVKPGQSIQLEALEDAELMTQVIPVNLQSRIKWWVRQSIEEKAENLKLFKSGRTPIFWQAGTYVLRAFTKSKAQNMSEVWERIVQVQDSAIVRPQVTERLWHLSQASAVQGPALVEVNDDPNQPTIRIKDLRRGSSAPIEIWRPEINAASKGLFTSGFGVNRQLIQGHFGLMKSTALQFCLARGSNAADSWRSSFQSRILCWERDSGGSLRVIVDQDATFSDQEDLSTANVNYDSQDEIFAISFNQNSIRIFRAATDPNVTAPLQELKFFGRSNTDTYSYLEPFTENNGTSYLVRADLGQKLAVVTEIVKAPNSLVPLTLKDFSFIPTKVGFYYENWGPKRSDSNLLPTYFSQWQTRFQPISSWSTQHPAIIYNDIRYNSRWARNLQTYENESTALLQEVSFEGLPENTNELCYYYLDSTTPGEWNLNCLSYHNEPASRQSAKIFQYDEQKKFWRLAENLKLDSLQEESLATESPLPIAEIANVTFKQPYTLAAASASSVRWSLLRLTGNEVLPDFETLNSQQKSRLQSGIGPLELWGKDERFALWYWQKSAAGEELSRQRREIRFEGSPILSADLGSNLGLVDLIGNGKPFLIEPDASGQGFAALSLTENKADWRLYSAVWPNFVKNPVTWNSRQLSFISGRILPDIQANPAFCYLAAADEQHSGMISCYAMNTNRDGLDQKLEMEFPLQKNEEIAAIQIAGTERTALMIFNRITTQITAYVLNASASGTGYSFQKLPWHRMKKIDADHFEKIEEAEFFSFREGDPDVLIQGTLHYGNYAVMEPKILHFSGQLQLGQGNTRFSILSKFTGSVTGGRLQKAPGEELAISLDLTELDMRANEFRRITIFGDDFLWDEHVKAGTTFGHFDSRTFYSNQAFSANVDNLQVCRVQSVLEGSVQIYQIPFCNPFVMQTPDYMTVSMDTFFEFNEEYLAQPDQLNTHWSFPIWMADDVTIIDPRELPVSAFLLRIPKNFSRANWQIQKSKINLPLRSLGEQWEPTRTFNLYDK